MERQLRLMLACARTVHLIADAFMLSNGLLDQSIGISAAKSLPIGYPVGKLKSYSARTRTDNFSLLQFIIRGGVECYTTGGVR